MISGIDIICAVAVVFLAVLGLRAGFLSSLLSVVLAYFTIFFSAGAARFSSGGSAFLSLNQQLFYAAIFFFLFLIIYIIGEFVIWALKKIISVRLMGPLDPIAAAILGGFKAFLIMGVFFSLAASFPLSSGMREIVAKSHFQKLSINIYQRTYPFAQAAIPKITRLFEGGSKIKEIDVSSVSSVVPAELVTKTVEIISKEASEIVKELAQ